MSLDLKHTEASFSPSTIDSLHLRVRHRDAYMSRPAEKAIFVWSGHFEVYGLLFKAGVVRCWASARCYDPYPYDDLIGPARAATGR
jgi:hypothetical protein